jgi:hypothetical protein
MPMRASSAAAIAALALVAISASPASAAVAPNIKSKGQYTVYESAYTSLNFQYRCAAGSVARIDAEIRQGGTAENPVSLYTTELSPPADLPAPLCDNNKHTGHLGAYLAGWTEENPTSDYTYFGDTSAGYGRGTVIITLTDLTTGATDTDHDVIGVTSRDNPL